MAKIKIKDIEGDAKEIHNLIQNVGFDLQQYLTDKPAKKPIPKIFMYISIAAFFIICCLVWTGVLNDYTNKCLTLLLFLLLGFVAITIQHNHNDWVVTALGGLTGLALILISLEVYSPKEVAKKIESKAGDTFKTEDQ